MSTVQKGNELRDFLKRILTAAQYRNIEVEKRIGSKKVDIYYEDLDLGETIKIAIEAKNYSRPLTKDYVKKEIIPDYQGILHSNELDRVIIIAPHEIGPDTRKFISEHGFKFLTTQEFQCNIMGFNSYMDNLKSIYKEGGLDSYYINPVFDQNQDLEEHLNAWVNGSSSKPIAILAGYGMGKTSFSRHFAASLANDFSPGKRIPISIRLGDISSEQSLEGLLSKSLTTTHGVVRFNFELFMELNKEGLFCIILDGFDEMKHTMSWDQFKYNIKQLNRLLDGNTRVLLLGRPSAFLSDSEHAMILSGIRKTNEYEVRSFEWAEYKKIELSPFTEERAYEFITKYIEYRISNNNFEKTMSHKNFVGERINEIKKLNLQDLILRPVQAKMLAEIACHPSNKLESYTRYGLYSCFIDMIIDRELEKESRKRITSEKRRSFIREIAWWLWNSKQTTSFAATEVPKEITAKYLDNKETHPTDLLRDLISGSILETKGSDRFYFPHRSYLEFLVSEHALYESWTTLNLENLSEALTQEISSFIRESKQRENLERIIETLPDYRGSLSILFLELLAWIRKDEKTHESLLPSDSPWLLFIEFLKISSRHDQNSDQTTKAFDFAEKSLTKNHSNEISLTAILCMLLGLSWCDEEKKNTLIVKLIGSILKASLTDLENIITKGKTKRNSKIAIPSGHNAPLTRLIMTSFSSTQDLESGILRIHVNLNSLILESIDLLSPQYVILGFMVFGIEEASANFNTLSSYYQELLNSQKGGIVTKYFKEYHKPERMVPVTSKKTNNLPRWATEPR
ncbi:NACHT domain-containing protein [Pseudomonas aeruginosa]|uniref:NACHT domain-containing protein n=1 Tax=Pseudomonas aeruginosa TaxID=287 RepID=UPI001BB04470|nr:NACHT domain-containing protein [Pseudomonas aeruginosa]